MNAGSAISFHFLYRQFKLTNRKFLKSFIGELLQCEGKSVDHISYIFCDDAYLLEINREYLKHHTYTDIITFSLASPKEPLVADIYISIPRVRENAESLKLSFNSELHRVLFHGALHLSGYKDKTAHEERVMRSKEDFYLRQYFVSRETL